MWLCSFIYSPKDNQSYGLKLLFSARYDISHRDSDSHHDLFWDMAGYNEIVLIPMHKEQDC